MLHLNHLKKSFGKNEILTDIEYTFEEGNIYPVLGGAGAGRTTLFECIAGDIAVDSGTVETKEKWHAFLCCKAECSAYAYYRISVYQYAL